MVGRQRLTVERSLPTAKQPSATAPQTPNKVLPVAKTYPNTRPPLISIRKPPVPRSASVTSSWLKYKVQSVSLQYTRSEFTTKAQPALSGHLYVTTSASTMSWHVYKYLHTVHSKLTKAPTHTRLGKIQKNAQTPTHPHPPTQFIFNHGKSEFNHGENAFSIQSVRNKPLPEPARAGKRRRFKRREGARDRSSHLRARKAVKRRSPVQTILISSSKALLTTFVRRALARTQAASRRQVRR